MMQIFTWEDLNLCLLMLYTRFRRLATSTKESKIKDGGVEGRTLAVLYLQSFLLNKIFKNLSRSYYGIVLKPVKSG